MEIMNDPCRSSPVLGIVVPCYNEKEVLPETISRLSAILDDLSKEGSISAESKILFVDDGSKDTTWTIIENYHQYNKFVSGLKLAKNAGHQNALFAGLMVAKESCDCVISIDADLQDDVNVIPEFINRFRNGYDVVYGVRKDRQTDTFFKRTTAQGFYKLMLAMGVNIVYNHADFRLMSKRTLEHLEQFPEINLFLRGIVPLIGFKSAEVYYDRNERFAGESKYPLKKMLAFAFEGITSFSVTPIRLVAVAGFALFCLSVIVGTYSLVRKILGYTETGWTSLMLSIWFIGGVQLISLGLIGEYIGKIYKEVKHRPKYIVERALTSQAFYRRVKQNEYR